MASAQEESGRLELREAAASVIVQNPNQNPKPPTSLDLNLKNSGPGPDSAHQQQPRRRSSADQRLVLNAIVDTSPVTTLVNTTAINAALVPTPSPVASAPSPSVNTILSLVSRLGREGSAESQSGNQNSNNLNQIPSPASLSLALSLCPPEQINEIHFLVGNKSEIALVPTNSSSDDIKDLFRSAAEAGPCDIVKLYTLEGRLINISPKIPPNSSSSPYRLEVVAVHCNGILMEQVGIDLLSLEKRVSALERILKNQGSPCDSIQELKEEVYQLRNKLENYEHLSWLGFYKALHPPPLPTPPRTPGVGYHKKSRGDKQIICDKFLQLCDVVLTRETCQLLREPTFDNWQWEDEEMLVLLQQMYLDLELPRKFDIEISILRNFLVNVYHHYNDVPFHNFRHCFCVTQMMFGMASYVNLAERVGDLEVLILLTSCICHDLDHPGYNNIYQINAQTELALRYNDISPLENHHCSIAFRILEDPECNIFRNLPTGTYRKIREGIIRCILATDMARHNEIVNQFREIVPYFDSTNKAHINLLSMVLIKVADISNEARPMDVAEPWLDCLLAEFFQQSDTEKLEGLPVTPFMDRDKITKPSSQCSFIGLVLLPLFEALGSFFAELEPLIIQPVRDALEYYRRLNEAAQASRHRKSTEGPPLILHNSASGTVVVTAPPSPPTTSTTTTTTFPTDSETTSTNTTTTTTAAGPTIDPTPGTTTIQSPTHQQHSSSNLRHKLPSDPCSVNRFARSSSDSNSMPNSNFAGTNSNSDSNPIATAHRRASQLLVRAPCSGGGSGSITSLRSSMTTRSGPGHFTSFPSLESDSEREGGDSEEEDDAITEVAVSEKALKFKIATESSFDFSRKSSRENKSESSVQSGTNSVYSHHSHHSNQHHHTSPTGAGGQTKEGSVAAAAAGGNVIASLACAASIMSDTAHAHAPEPRKTSPTKGERSQKGPMTEILGSASSIPASPTNGSSNPNISAAKIKAKDSFFTRLKQFTERLSISDSGASASECGSGGGSPSSVRKVHAQGFGYFRRSGRSKSSNEKHKNTVSISGGKDDRQGSSTSVFGGRRGHRGSNSDGDEFLRRHHTIHTTQQYSTGGQSEAGAGELVSPENSPALSRAGEAEEAKSCESSSWKECSGSLDSILSKDENKRSPSRKLMLPRFSSFVHKRTRMGFMRRLSPKGSSSDQEKDTKPPTSPPPPLPPPHQQSSSQS